MWLCALAILAAACGRDAPAPPIVPQVSGTIEIDGLTAPVRVVRDRWGVPHIYAQTRDDLFEAQGFVQAQDRLFQMDLWRRSVQGRLSEVLGANFIERDAMTRRVQYQGDLEAEWASYGPDARSIAAAFVRGINAWVAIARDRPPDAFVVAGWTPAYWSASDLLNRTDAFMASGDAADEIRRRHLDDLIAEGLRRVGAPPFFAGLAAALPGEARDAPPDPIARVDASAIAVRSPGSAGVARGGGVSMHERADRLTSPSPRYVVHLNAPGWNVIGVTAPWRAGVAAGHNDRIAWTSAPIAVDTQDLFVRGQERQAREDRHDRKERSAAFTIVKDAIVVKGRRVPFTFETEYTPDGVVIASDTAHDRVFTLRWSGLEPGAAPELAALALDVAGDWTAFRAALARWKMPPRRVVYADIDGNIGFQDAALIPRRTSRADGSNAWGDWLTADELPHAFNPRDTIQSTAAGGNRGDAASQAEFVHVLGITERARRRFGVGPIDRPSDDVPVRLLLTPPSWDTSTAINAPGQSEAAGPHFGDLAKLWSGGKSFPLVFSDAAVDANSTSTLVLRPRQR
jgi:penicillin G amidase